MGVSHERPLRYEKTRLERRSSRGLLDDPRDDPVHDQVCDAAGEDLTLLAPGRGSSSARPARAGTSRLRPRERAGARLCRGSSRSTPARRRSAAARRGGSSSGTAGAAARSGARSAAYPQEAPGRPLRLEDANEVRPMCLDALPAPRPSHCYTQVNAAGVHGRVLLVAERANALSASPCPWAGTNGAKRAGRVVCFLIEQEANKEEQKLFSDP